MSVTMKDIAARAHVSIYTVSRALNDKDDINKHTRERILKISNEMGYVTNVHAKSLVTKKTNTIGLINSRSIDPFYFEKYEAINEVCFRRGYSILVCSSQDKAERELEYLQQMQANRVDGILIDPTQNDERYIDFLKNYKIPYVFINRHPAFMDCCYVKNDNVHGGYIAVNHLLEKGYKRITYICAKPNTTTGRERIQGCKQAIAERGLLPGDLTVESCEETIDACYQLVKERLCYDKIPDAIFVWNDRLALGARNAIYDAGLSIPDDIAIMGYDNIEISKYLTPPLTTVLQESYKIGELAAHILLDKIESKGAEGYDNQYILKPELVVRNTT